MRRRRGVSTIIGTLIFLLILMVAFYTFVTIFGYYNGYSQDVAKQEQEQQRFDETSLSISGFSFGSSPNTVASSAAANATASSFQRKIFFNQGLWWVFYSTGSSINYATSSDGLAWSSPIFVTNSTGGDDFDLWQSGSTVYYALTSNETLLWRYGSLENSGAVSWSIPETIIPTINAVTSVSIVPDSEGNLWIAGSTNNGSASSIEVWKYSSGNWNEVDEISPVPSDSIAILVPLENGVCLIYGEAQIAPVNLTTTTDGSTWSNPVSPSSDFSLLASSAVSSGNTVYFVGLASSSLGSKTGTVNSWSFSGELISEETVLDNVSSNWTAAISMAGSGTLIAYYGTNNSIYMQYNFGSSWSSPLTLSNSESSASGLTSSFSGAGLAWQSGNKIRFALVPTLTTVNNSPFAVHLISLYVYNPSTQTLVHFDTNVSASGVTGSFDYWIGAGEVMSIPLPIFPWNPSQNYLVTMTTDEGALFSASFPSPT
jgi:hypothetical protein